MKLEQVNHPAVTVGTMITFALSLSGLLAYELTNAGEFAAVQTQVEAIQQSQSREIEIQKERHEDNRDRIEDVKDDIGDIKELLLESLKK